MNLEKVIFGFFIVLAATLNFGFFLGDIERPELHNVYELAAALIVSLIATALKFGDRTQINGVPRDQAVATIVEWIARRENAFPTAELVQVDQGTST